MRTPYPLTHVRPDFGPDLLGDWLAKLTFEPRGFGHHRRDPAAVCGMRVIGDMELIVVNGGESRIVFPSGTVVLRAGDMILIPPFTPHAIETPADNPHDDYWLHFDVGPASGQMQFLSALRPSCGQRVPLRDPQAWRDACAAFEREWDKPQPGIRTIFQAFVLSMAVRLCREVWPDGRPPDSRTVDGGRRNPHIELVEAIAACIRNELDVPWNAELLAERFRVGTSTLRKAFSARMGMPLHRYVVLCRVRRAEVLLRTTGLTLDEIAAVVGFSSAPILSEAFRRIYLASPREWLASGLPGTDPRGG